MKMNKLESGQAGSRDAAAWVFLAGWWQGHRISRRLAGKEGVFGAGCGHNFSSMNYLLRRSLTGKKFEAVPAHQHFLFGAALPSSTVQELLLSLSLHPVNGYQSFLLEPANSFL